VCELHESSLSTNKHSIARLLLPLTQMHIQTEGSGTGPPTKVGEADKAACYCGEANDQGIGMASEGQPPGQYL
jgi:hypothetical protein